MSKLSEKDQARIRYEQTPHAGSGTCQYCTSNPKNHSLVRDFLGQELHQGDFVVYPGGGNTKCEYGLLLLWILEVADESIKVVRLDPNHQKKMIEAKKSTIKAFTKVVKVQPPKRMIEVFHQAWEGDGTKYYQLVSSWVHGRTEIDWKTLTIGETRD